MADPIRVDIPGVGLVEFPDSMSADDVNAAAKRLHDQAQPHPPAQSPVAAAASEGKSPLAIGAEMGKSLLTDPAYRGGFLRSMGQTATATAKGIGEGALDAVNPMSYARGATNLATDLIATGGINTGEGVLQGAKAIASGDPTAGGHAIGNLAMGGVIGRGLGFLRTKVNPAPPSPTIDGVSVDELRAAGVGDHAINATMNGRTPLKFPQPPLKIASPPSETPSTVGNLALKPQPMPAEPPPSSLGTPRVISYKNYSDNFSKGTETPWSASSQFGPNAGDWASGETPGSADALQASGLHRETAAMDSRFKYLMDSPNGFARPSFLVAPGRAAAGAIGAALAQKLGLPYGLGMAAGAMSPEIATGVARGATSPVGAAALRAAILARLTSANQTTDGAAGTR